MATLEQYKILFLNKHTRMKSFIFSISEQTVCKQKDKNSNLQEARNLIC